MLHLVVRASTAANGCPRNSLPDGALTQQPVDDAGRGPGQAERQRHAHQQLVAVEFGWWRAQRIPVLSRFNT